MFELERHIDFDWAIDLYTCQSTIGYLFILAGVVVSILSKHKHLVILFSIKAEYVAYYRATKGVV